MLPRISFRNGFAAGLVLALALGLYLFFLWQPRRQVQLHSKHFLRAVERKSWSKAGDFLDAQYRDQWEQDRGAVLARLREVARYLRNFHVQIEGVPIIRVSEGQGDWRGRITVEADENEASVLVKARINALETPFALRWQQRSRKPWDWKLVSVTNPDLKLPAGSF